VCWNCSDVSAYNTVGIKDEWGGYGIGKVKSQELELLDYASENVRNRTLMCFRKWNKLIFFSTQNYGITFKIRLVSFSVAETAIQKISVVLYLVPPYTWAYSVFFNELITEKLMRFEALTIMKESSKIKG
jgi:hypothetical protein